VPGAAPAKGFAVDPLNRSRGRLGGVDLDRRQLLRGIAATGALAGAEGLLAACGSVAAKSAEPVAGGGPKRGGHLRVGLTGGSSSDTIDPHKDLTYTDTARLQSLYDPLVQLNAQAEVEFVLAESITPDEGSASEWIIRLRPGVTFHDGKDFTSADVLYNFQRIISNKFSGANGLGPIDLKNTKALDAHTVLVSMSKPFASFVEQLAAFWFYLYMAPEGFNPAKPVGTGPFVYQSFTPGARSVFTRNANYWRNGLPYADTLTIIDFDDTFALADALILGQIDAAGTLDGVQVPYLGNRSGVITVASPAGTIIPFTMRTDRPPFSDVRVRQAMRLLVNRPQMIDTALDGFGTWASDVFSPFDSDFDASLHRIQDLPQAMFLLKQAGREDLTVTLVTSAIATGTIAMATVLAEQAQAAGVTIRLQQVPPGTLFGPDYLNWTFSQDYYDYSPYLPQVANSMLPISPFNETHTNNKRYTILYDQANATLDDGLRKQIVGEMQMIDFYEGGYIIPAYVNSLDAYSTKLRGYGRAKVGQPLSNTDFMHFWFA
jgi:peptide/nickel transport system substrate-binding protein